MLSEKYPVCLVALVLLCSIPYSGGRFVAKLVTIEVYDSKHTFALPISGPAINIALKKVQKLYNDTIDFQVAFRNNSCDAYKVGAIAADVYYNSGVTAFIGPACPNAVETLGYMAADWNIPLITPAGGTKLLKNITKFPTVTKLSPFGLDQFAEFATSVLSFFHWRHIALIYDNRDREEVSAKMGRTFFQHFKTSKFDLTHLPLRPKQINRASYIKVLERGSESARVFILHATSDIVRDILLTAHDIGYTTGEYVFLVTVSLRNTVSEDIWKVGDDRDEDARRAFQCVFFLALREYDNKKYNTFKDNVIENALENWDLDVSHEMEDATNTARVPDPGDFVRGYHDAVTIYARAIHEHIKEGLDPNDGRAVSRRMWGRTHTGIEGNVTLDAQGARDADLSLLDLTPDGQVLAVGSFRGQTKEFREIPGRTITWPEDTGPPADVPECGFSGLRCTYKDVIMSAPRIMGISVGSGVAFLVILMILGVYVHRYKKGRKVVDKMWWRIDKQDIQIGGQAVSMSVASLNSKVSFLTPKSDVVPNYSGCYGSYKGCWVRLKKLALTSIVVDESLIQEFLEIRELNCDNILRIYGACLEGDNMLLVTELCPKGSLQEVIGKGDVNLDAQFKFSLCNDIVKGMTYIHESPLKKHGRLTSYACLIDNCFSVKIADYGPQKLFSQIPVDFKSQEYKRDCLWRAPEHLRRKDLRGSQEGDVYSFGIIMQEIFSRDTPYFNEVEEKGIDAVLSKVKKGGQNPLRPQFEAPSSMTPVKGLMSRCWDENPKERPTFQMVKKELKILAERFGASGNFFDNLLRRMEQYANNLEKLVDEKTHRVREEKKRTEELLHQIIPKSVANQLKQGKKVKPDSFDCVTVCFTDICGFTSLAARSTPMQVVDLLNDLYSCFDDIIDGYDVYKVETIGDAYMVVSGLPLRNGDRHAPEISRMALSLIRAIETIRIDHLPTERLKLRVGIHSGSVCAGIVGQKMPRYCLFGDTVIIASRMESHGEACKIHISVETKHILDRCGIFVIGTRGAINIKGLGQMTTYWLLGEKIWNS